MKRAQIKIQQMAFMLIAVTLFFALVTMVVLSFMFSGLKSSAIALEEQNALLLVTKLANSPEFSCGDSFGSSKSNCVDADKIMALKSHKDEYENFWSVSNIEIRKIFSESNADVICTKNNYPDCGIIRILDEDVKGYSISNFVTLCRKEADIYSGNKCELAKIIVSYEEVE